MGAIMMTEKSDREAVTAKKTKEETAIFLSSVSSKTAVMGRKALSDGLLFSSGCGQALL